MREVDGEAYTFEQIFGISIFYTTLCLWHFVAQVSDGATQHQELLHLQLFSIESLLADLYLISSFMRACIYITPVVRPTSEAFNSLSSSEKPTLGKEAQILIEATHFFYIRMQVTSKNQLNFTYSNLDRSKRSI